MYNFHKRSVNGLGEIDYRDKMDENLIRLINHNCAVLYRRTNL
jgi:hypothetical protein